jgi:hypothetical protein
MFSGIVITSRLITSDTSRARKGLLVVVMARSSMVTKVQSLPPGNFGLGERASGGPRSSKYLKRNIL